MLISRKHTGISIAALTATICVPVLIPGVAFAQDGNDVALSGAQVEQTGACTTLQIQFNSRIQVLSSFPNGRGRELQVRVQLLDPQSSFSGRETLRAPAGVDRLRSIEFDGSSSSGPMLTLFFTKDMQFDVSASENARGVVIRLSEPGAFGSCNPQATTTPAGSAASPQDAAETARLVAEAEQQLREGAFGGAVEKLSNAMAKPGNENTPRALELLGLAYERAGQPDQARARYEDYLRQFPANEGAERVQQRFSALQASGQASGSSGPAPQLREAQTQVRAANQWAWGIRGSLSEFYYRDQGRTTTLNTASELGQSVDKSLNVNQLMSTGDVTITGGNDRRQIQIRATGSFTKNFGTSASIIDINQGTQRLTFRSSPGGGLGSLTALYIDYADRDLRSSVRIGRQNRNSAGVLGRFDGGLLGFQVNPGLRFNVVGGFPVESSHQLFIKTDRPFYGFSADFGKKRSPVQATIYWYDQHAPDGFIDRRSIGAEVRYLHKRFNAFALVDYDVKFKRLNLGIVTLNYNFPDTSNLSITADYRQSPLLRTSNVLGIQDENGTRITELAGLRPFFTDPQIYRAAIDNTLVAKSVTVNYTRPITKKLQINTDFNMTDTGGSRGVLAVPGVSFNPQTGFAIDPIPETGKEFYYGAELIGSGMFQENDIYTIGGRYADTATARVYTIDVSGRVPVNSTLRLNPRFRYGHRNDKITAAVPVPGTFTQLQPTMRLNYYPVKHTEVEVEFGGNFSTKKDYSMGSLATTKESGWVLSAGFRVDF